MVMHEEDIGVRDSPVSLCGHRNPPGAHFCDACGVRLPMRCSRCAAINRGQANFCSNCGAGLRDVPRTHVTPAIVPYHSSMDRSAAQGSPSLIDRAEPSQPAKQTANGGKEGSDSDDPFTRAPESGTELPADEDTQHLRQIARFAQQRRRRAWVWLATVGTSIVIGLLGAALVWTHTVILTAGPPPLIGTNTQGVIATPAAVIEPAAITQPTPAPTGRLDTTVQPDRDKGLPAPAGVDTLPLVAPTHGRAGDESAAHRKEPVALRNREALHSNTLLRNATTPSAGDRHAGSVLRVGSDSLVVDEVGRAGEEQKLHVTITPKTRIIESRRNPAASDAQDSFTDKTISLAEVEKGDYVVVDASQEGTRLVATSVTVTLRGSAP
jgi:hypothetical protein